MLLIFAADKWNDKRLVPPLELNSNFDWTSESEIISMSRAWDNPGGEGTSLTEVNGDVPLDGVAFSRL